jgi:two-component system KDP operon response regulator KdpE
VAQKPATSRDRHGADAQLLVTLCLKIQINMILIVDDDPGLRRVLQTVLRIRGFEVSVASTGEQAIHEVASRQYDAVLLDVDMPGIGGVETCQRLRRLAPSLQILMHTVRDNGRDRRIAFDAGADDYVVKPCPFPELVARLKAAVHKARDRVGNSQPEST